MGELIEGSSDGVLKSNVCVYIYNLDEFGF